MITEGLKGRDFITLRDFTKAEIETMLDVGLKLKADNTMRGRHDDILPGRTLFMMFFNPSLRTRNSFEAGIFQLGGHAHFLEPDATRLPTLEGEDVRYESERISDVARVLSRMGDAIAIRILGDTVDWEYDKTLRIIEEFAKWSQVPVINMEDNIYHPCQGMADAMTLWEMFGRDLRGRKLGVTWTYSPSTKKPIAPHHDFMYAASLFGADIVFAHPPEMRIDPDIEAGDQGQRRGQRRLVRGGRRHGRRLRERRRRVRQELRRPRPAAARSPPSRKQDEMVKLFEKYKGWIADEQRMNLAKPSATTCTACPASAAMR